MIDDNFDENDTFHEMPDVAMTMIATLHVGFMKKLQTENKCNVTGIICREPEKCGCYLELAVWCGNE